MSDLTGHCFCRAVTFSANDVEPRPVMVCHCKQCRQFAGYTWAATALPEAALVIEGAEQITWFQSSAKARRAFCQVCGSTLFWQQEGSPNLSISAGIIDQEDQLRFGSHIYVDHKPSYYTLADEHPQYAVDTDAPSLT